jgi:hypothetical protein
VPDLEPARLDLEIVKSLCCRHPAQLDDSPTALRKGYPTAPYSMMR